MLNTLGGNIEKGHILGKVDIAGDIDMVYHYINKHGEIRTAKCKSTPYFTDNGILRLKEVWQWTDGDQTYGISEIEEI